MLSMSVNLCSGFAGLVTLGHGGLWAVSAYGVGYVVTKLGGGYGLQILVALNATLLVTLLFGLMAMRTARVYFIMITLAQGMIIWGLSIRLSSITGAENGLRGLYRPPMVSGYVKFYYLSLAVILICGFLIWVITRSPVGYSLLGIRESETRMRSLGYNTSVHKLYGFMLSGFFAGIAGIMFAYFNEFISPSAAELRTSAIALMMAILGGIGTIIGPIVGAFIVVFMQNYMSLHVERWPTIIGLVFILVVLFARKGIVGAVSVVWKRLVDIIERNPDLPNRISTTRNLNVYSTNNENLNTRGSERQEF
jgi:branched-chain amino acid transport system permease protein